MRNEKGQSTIEFLSTLSFVLAIIFFYVKMALNITNGYLMHYATFMASRAYLVGDDAGTNAASRAKDNASIVYSTIQQYALPFDEGGALEFNEPQSVDKKVFVGARTSFKQKFSFSELVGGTALMHYISESFLGREPSISECIVRTCQMIELATGVTGCDSGFTVIDNGC